MSLTKLKKAELQEIITANNLSFDPDWTKDELIAEIEHAELDVNITETDETETEPEATTQSVHTRKPLPGVPGKSPGKRQQRLMDRYER